jgi:hypothetical protein
MILHNHFYKDALGWGTLLWLFGYVLGILFFFIMPKNLIGWIITPIATVFTLWVLMKKIGSNSLQYYFLLAVIWTIIAIVLDYFFIVKAFKPVDGYYKPDVYLYYTLTFALPLIVGFWKSKRGIIPAR